MGKYDGFLLCSDIDGTLTYEKGKVSEKNKKSIEYFMSEGGYFTFASGRFPEFIREIPISPNAPILSLNGALIYNPRNNSIIAENFLHPSVLPILKKTYTDCSSIVNYLKVYRKNEIKIAPEDGTDFLMEQADIYKAVFSTDNEENALILKDYIKTFENEFFKVRRSWTTGVEIIGNLGNKGYASVFLKKYLGANTLVTVGDFENDIDMLSSADISYAVMNASNEIKKYAVKSAPRNTEDAISFVINDLLI